MGTGKVTSLAYLVGHYPAITHTFILREVLELRQIGFDIQTASVNQAEVSNDGATEQERDEEARTFYVKARGWPGILMDHTACLISRPHRYLAGLAFAVRLARLDLSAALRHCFYFAEAVVIGQWMRRKALHHLHVHFAVATSTVAMLVKKIFGTPYSITVHGPDEFYGVRHHHLAEKVGEAAFIVCIGQFCRSQLMMTAAPRYWEKLEVCPLGVDPNEFQPRHLPAPTFQILCVGRLVPRKGQAVLVEATARLVKRGREVQLSLVGDGPDREALEGAAARLNISESVTFHGWINQRRIREFMETADVFVLPSFAEGVPVCLMEAMAMEIPCISTFVAGIPELIESGKHGILVPPSDPELLAAAVEKLIGDPELRLRLARGGRRRVLEKYDLQVNVRRLAAILERRLLSELQEGRDDA